MNYPVSFSLCVIVWKQIIIISIDFRYVTLSDLNKRRESHIYTKLQQGWEWSIFVDKFEKFKKTVDK